MKSSLETIASFSQCFPGIFFRQEDHGTAEFADVHGLAGHLVFLRQPYGLAPTVLEESRFFHEDMIYRWYMPVNVFARRVASRLGRTLDANQDLEASTLLRIRSARRLATSGLQSAAM